MNSLLYNLYYNLLNICIWQDFTRKQEKIQERRHLFFTYFFLFKYPVREAESNTGSDSSKKTKQTDLQYLLLNWSLGRFHIQLSQTQRYSAIRSVWDAQECKVDKENRRKKRGGRAGCWKEPGKVLLNS